MIDRYSKSIHVPSFDSFKWRIELSKVDIINSNLLDHIVNLKTNITTGEIIEEIPIQSNSLKVHFDKYHIHFAINKIFGVEYLVVLINSKLLESDYLEGISMINIENIFNKIMSCEVFSCSFELFLSEGLVSDIDIKKDVLSSPKEFREILKLLDKGSKAHKRAKHGINVFTQKDNLGAEWNTRPGASFTHPFLKIYHKGIETKCSKNREFFAEYLDVHEVSDRVRIECTIKSFREAQKHGFQDNTLLTLLKSTTNDLNRIIEHAVTSNLEPRLKVVHPRTKSELSNTELIMFLYLTELIKEKGVSFENALFHILEHQPKKTQRNRLKIVLTKVYQEQIEGEKFEVKSRSINTFFSSLGWK
jgi:hypothetical protein